MSFLVRGWAFLDILPGALVLPLNRQVPTSAQNETFVTKNKFDLHGRGFGQAKRLVAAHHTSLP